MGCEGERDGEDPGEGTSFLCPSGGTGRQLKPSTRQPAQGTCPVTRLPSPQWDTPHRPLTAPAGSATPAWLWGSLCLPATWGPQGQGTSPHRPEAHVAVDESSRPGRLSRATGRAVGVWPSVLTVASVGRTADTHTAGGGGAPCSPSIL